jgi:hypothetical protein
MARLRKVVYDSWLGRRCRTSRLGIATLEGVAGVMRMLPVPRRIFDPADETWQQFHYFDHGQMRLPESLGAEFESVLVADAELNARVNQLRRKCPRIGMVFSSGRAGTRSFSLFLGCKNGLAALHRPGDVGGFETCGLEVDPGFRNSIVYGLMLGPREDDWWRQHVEYVVSLLEFAASVGVREFWLTAHRWNCYFPIIELVLGRKCPALLLDRDDRKIVHSMISRNQYCPATADPDRETTWVNVEPQLAGTVKHGAEHLRLTGAPLFDRVSWYVHFVRYWFKACTDDGRDGGLRAALNIDDLAARPVDSFQLLDRVVGLPGQSPEDLMEQFAIPKNVKPRSTQTGLRFPAIERWAHVMRDRLHWIGAQWKSRESG